ncbi:hypothetical protein M9H77_32904 [Catharanthus roseus]|uniref:Uncharacterized protein n=1 Tax=Catharanthus roseus TaxID=4058 RepID=A0ACC0A5G9_CATRO|nr:hypothetical protein M9H77_32904 [Catharanthus roseus]
MMEARRKAWMEEFAIITGLIGMQFIYAGNSVFVSYLMTLGFKPSTLIILSTVATFVVLAPASFFFERNKWPRKFKLKLWMQLILISFSGVTLFQSLILKGISLTSPAMATAMPNLAPGFIFFIAWGFGLEKVKLNCKYSKIKIAGTLLCVGGAIVMSLMQSIVNADAAKEPQLSTLSPPSAEILDGKKIAGSAILLAAVIILSSTIVLQAATLRELPAPISLNAITSFIGVVFTIVFQLIREGKIETGLPILSIKNLISYSLLAGCVNGACVTFNVWAMKKRGPVLVSIFSPVGTVIAVVLSLITLEQSISLGSFGGMCIMFGGLYCVLWAKRKEEFSIYSDDSHESEYDMEKPLLS